MAQIAADRIKDTTTTTGTGNLTLSGSAPSGFRAFSAVAADNDTFFYCVAHQSANEWEIGLGAYVSATPALARTSVIASSNADAAVNFAAGTKDVFITSPAAVQPWGVLTVTPSANQNDYNPTGIKYANVLRINSSASIKLTGLANGAEGRRVTIVNASTDFLLWLENENTASSAANRFDLPKGFPAFLMPGDAITLLYDGTASRWLVSEWPSQGQAMGLSFFSDFLESTNGGCTATVSGTGASNQVSAYLSDTTEKPLGIAQIDTGTTNSGRATLGNAGTDQFPCASFPCLSVARLAAEAANSASETWQLISGFADSAGGTFTDGAAWNLRWNGSAAEWSQDRLSNATATRSVTGSPTPDTTYIWLIVFLNANWTRADFIYSQDGIAFTKADSPTTGLPANTRDGAWVAASMIKSAGSTQRNCSIDLAGYRADYVRS